MCAIGDTSLSLLERIEFPTTTPGETLGRAIDFFRSRAENGGLAALGIGSFGPVDPRPDSPAWGYITTTPKKGWQHTDFAGSLGRALDVPVGFDTDTNAAALGEGTLGAAKGLHTFAYLTIGTGIGGGGPGWRHTNTRPAASGDGTYEAAARRRRRLRRGVSFPWRLPRRHGVRPRAARPRRRAAGPFCPPITQYGPI